jgi:hypothetical protein
MYDLKSAVAATAVAVVWGTLRWTVRRRAFQPEALKVRVPLTVFGAITFWGLAQAETKLLGHKSRTDIERYYAQPTITMINSMFLWAMFAITPYAIVPSMAYPLGEFVSNFIKDPMGIAIFSFLV